MRSPWNPRYKGSVWERVKERKSIHLRTMKSFFALIIFLLTGFASDAQARASKVLFDTISASDIDYIEITDVRNTRDTNLSWHPRRLDKKQIQSLCEKVNNSVTIDTPYLNYNAEFSMLAYFKNHNNIRYFAKAGMIQQNHTLIANIRTKKLSDNNFFSGLWENSKEAECDCDVMTLADTIRSLYPDSPDGRYFVLDSTHRSDHMNEEPFCFNVVKDSGDYFMINWEPESKLPFIWLKKSPLMVTMARNYAEPFVIRSEPDRRKPIIAMFPRAEIWDSKILIVKNCSKGWVKVSFDFNHKHYTGWVEYNGYCSNPYTTCN